MNEYIQDRNIRHSCYAVGLWTIALLAIKVTMPLPLFAVALLLYVIPLTCFVLSVMSVMELRDRHRAMWEVYMPTRMAESDYERSYRQSRGDGDLVVTYKRGTFGWGFAGIRHTNAKEDEFYAKPKAFRGWLNADGFGCRIIWEKYFHGACILREVHDKCCLCSYCTEGKVGIILPEDKGRNSWRAAQWKWQGRLHVIRWTLPTWWPRA